jgi:hypothetical protein
MKMRNWTVLLLTGLMLAWGVTAFAATATDDDSRVLRQPVARGTILEVTLLDTKGNPVSGAKVTAVRDDLNQVEAITGPDGIAVLDGLPMESKGTVHQMKNLRAVNWDIRLQSGKINYLTVRHNIVCYGINPRKYRNPLIVKLPVHQPRYEQRWAPISYVGANLPLKGDKFLDDNWQQLTYHPTGKGQITQAYYRPWGVHEGLAELPVVPWWHISVYSVVNCDKPAAAPAQ